MPAGNQDLINFVGAQSSIFCNFHNFHDDRWSEGSNNFVHTSTRRLKTNVWSILSVAKVLKLRDV